MVDGENGAIQPSYGKDSSTALFDSVYLSVATAHRQAINKRRAVILITDGGDNHSRYSLKETMTFLEEADTPIFAVVSPPVYILQSIFDPPKRKQKNPSSPKIELPGGVGPIHSAPFERETDADVVGPAERRGSQNLKELAEASGGGVFTASNEDDLPRIVHALGKAVRYAYLLEYAPSGLNDVKRPNDWNGRHKLKIELTPPERFRRYATYFKRGYNDSER
jgi:Ca-activated chloride channel family protein